jgi:hypothetical protein
MCLFISRKISLIGPFAAPSECRCPRSSLSQYLWLVGLMRVLKSPVFSRDMCAGSRRNRMTTEAHLRFVSCSIGIWCRWDRNATHQLWLQLPKDVRLADLLFTAPESWTCCDPCPQRRLGSLLFFCSSDFAVRRVSGLERRYLRFRMHSPMRTQSGVRHISCALARNLTGRRRCIHHRPRIRSGCTRLSGY